MEHQLEVAATPVDVAADAAERVSRWAREAVADHGSFTFAVSGGHTPWAMFEELARDPDVPWEQMVLYQVDERCAPEGDPDRNLVHLRDALSGRPARIEPMPVEDEDLDAAADRYAAALPERFDLVHLGLGPDGHTASLVPGDPVLEVTDRLVAPTGGLYQGRRRMTVTYSGLARAARLMWLVTGEEKVTPLKALLAGDPSIPAGRVEVDGPSVVLADMAAAGRAGG